ncbi:hypothetical protein B0H66DRAFT_537814 [Apodospora peruviana]|uniref:Uncharacterized protein n=1 Tax=Apodospora peruviana TaxID=516989 RepID=A0AAE0HUB2_9PEZI|nr:hypothetical protein B0H66DRAFT_537814 [Apodospora peruviana]
MANNRNPDASDLMSQLQRFKVPDYIREPIRESAQERGNTPHGLEEHMFDKTSWLPRPRDPNKVWIVDRILEPQTIMRYMEYMVTGDLPSGKKTSFPLLQAEDINHKLAEPYASWAPTPFNAMPDACSRQVMDHIGSYDDEARLQIVSKDLHAMKSRLWEAMVPLSERRWREKKLDETENFSVACQLMSWVVNAFRYLNTPRIKADLRETYNLIHGKLETFATAFNLVRAAEEPPREAVNVTGMWAEFMQDHYEVVVSSAHNWVTEHVDRLRTPVLDRLGSYEPDEEREGGPFPPTTSEDFARPYDDVQWGLTNQLHDLVEIQAQADYVIFLPMDGYKGVPPPAEQNTTQDAEQATGAHPLVFSPDIEKRRERYVMRLKMVSREMMKGLMQRLMLQAVTGNGEYEPPLPVNSGESLRETSEQQVRAQKQAGLELRGEKVVHDGKLKWVRSMSRPDTKTWHFGFVVYRVTGGSDEEWEEFKTQLEGDAAHWGGELEGAEAIREDSRLHWIDGREQWAEGGIDGLRRHFGTVVEAEDFNFWDSIFLVADEQTVQSYTDPLPESVPPGDNLPSILAVDAVFTEESGDESESVSESPGFNGEMRILTSLLWDELSVFLYQDTYRLFEMWPLASRHPRGVYTGPITAAQEENWRLLYQQLKKDALKRHGTGRDQQRAAAADGNASGQVE